MSIGVQSHFANSLGLTFGAKSTLSLPHFKKAIERFLFSIRHVGIVLWLHNLVDKLRKSESCLVCPACHHLVVQVGVTEGALNTL